MSKKKIKKINKNKKIELGLTLDELDIIRHLLWDEYWRRDKELNLVYSAVDQTEYNRIFREQKKALEEDKWAGLGQGKLYEMEEEKDQVWKLRNAVSKAYDFESEGEDV